MLFTSQCRCLKLPYSAARCTRIHDRRSQTTLPETRTHQAHANTSQASDGLPVDAVPFATAKCGPFYQEGPHMENQFHGDGFLQRNLQRIMPKEVYKAVQPDIENFGHRVATDIYQLGRECELNPPSLNHYDAYGNKVDEIVTCSAWKRMKSISAEEGLIGIAYERASGEYSRLHQMTKLFLFHPSSGLYSCPLAMTDGAAKTIEALKLTKLSDAYNHLITRQPGRFWTSGQWMTERRGGSDVGHGTETVALRQEDGSYRLYGYKWFSSATDADMALTLARIIDSDYQTKEGSSGLSMFYVKLQRLTGASGPVQGIDVVRLKDKLGTRQLPTAELLLDGLPAQIASSPGRGVASIANMLTITRLHNAAASISAGRRVLSLARDYSRRRKAFGHMLHKHPLHVATLADMEVEVRGGLALLLEGVRLLGREDCGIASDRDLLLLRLLTPLVKLYTGKRCVPLVSEGIECFGGLGYLEDTGLPGLLRDVQVTPIWEGTTNVLSLDVLRAIAKTQGEVLVALRSAVQETTTEAVSRGGAMAAVGNRIQDSLSSTLDFVKNNPDLLVTAARDVSFSLAQISAGWLLLQHSLSQNATASDQLTSKLWCNRDLSPVVTKQAQSLYSQDVGKGLYELVFDTYDTDNLC